MSLFKDFFPPNIKIYISTREPDFTLPESGEVFNLSQRDSLIEAGFDPWAVINLRQVHGKDVLSFKDTVSPSGQPRMADGSITNISCVALAVRTADCLPVFLCDTEGNSVGIVHAGWKGTLEKISVDALRQMDRLFGIDAGNMKVAFGPSIHGCCFEVRDDVARYFSGQVDKRDGKMFVDLAEANRSQLIEAGVSESNIMDCGICTCCHSGYHSYRRDGEKAGRFISIIMMRE